MILLDAFMVGIIIVCLASGLATIGNWLADFHAKGMARVAKYNTKLEDKS
jgi:hypothetical protein